MMGGHMTLSYERQQIANHVRELEGEQVKSLVLNWFAATDANLTDFERLLAADHIHPDSAEILAYGELDQTLNFYPMTEDQMAQQSLNALEEYQKSGNGVTQDQLQEWADSLGSNAELTCPQ
jgi:hypothetical protein